MKKNSMTEGNILYSIISFAFPLLIGNLFQQLYNTVDAIVVGNFVGSRALAAVGSSGAIINLMIGAFMGLAAGSGILISYYYGAKDKRSLGSAIHNSMAMVLVAGIILTAAGVFMSKRILFFIDTPAEVIRDADIYLKLYFIGIIPSLVYNMGAGILRAVGDSKRPLYYLMAASILNLILDIVFVTVFSAGVAGAAVATGISQLAAAGLVMYHLVKTSAEYKISIRKIGFEKRMIGKLLRLGLPSAVQNGVVSFSNLLVQGNVNAFGSAAMAGYGAYSKIDGFVLLPISSINLTITTVVGQNLGAGKTKRIRESVRISVLIMAAVIAVSSVFLFLFGEQLLGVFTEDKEPIYYGMRMLKVLAPSYILVAMTHTYCGVIRGLKNTIVPTIVLVSTMCIMRIIWLTVMVPVIPEIETVFLGYTVTWIVSCCWIMGYYYRSKYVKGLLNNTYRENIEEKSKN